MTTPYKPSHHPLSPDQIRTTVTVSVGWDKELWDDARKHCIQKNIKLSTLVWKALRRYKEAGYP